MKLPSNLLFSFVVFVIILLTIDGSFLQEGVIAEGVMGAAGNTELGRLITTNREINRLSKENGILQRRKAQFEHDTNQIINIIEMLQKIFSFVQYEIFERLSYWMDLSMNRVAIWIK
eukprot:390006_1